CPLVTKLPSGCHKISHPNDARTAFRIGENNQFLLLIILVPNRTNIIIINNIHVINNGFFLFIIELHLHLTIEFVNQKTDICNYNTE
ncbi:MAG: hypothetical protein ACYDEX_23345, partial [Mobilitalea sp.]